MLIQYQKCSLCGVFADDGGFQKKQFICHDCLDSLDEIKDSLINDMNKTK